MVTRAKPGCDVSLHTRGSIAHWLGLLARMLDRPDEATAHLRQAIERNEAMGYSPRATESRYELARMLASRPDAAAHAEARALRERALRDAEAMGMQPLLGRLQALG